MTHTSQQKHLNQLLSRGLIDEVHLTALLDDLPPNSNSSELIAILERNMATTSQSALLLNLLGQCYLIQNRRGAARLAFQWALNRNPAFWKAEANLAIVCTILKAYRNAIKHAQNVLSDHSELVELRLIIIRALIALGRIAEATEVLEQVKTSANPALSTLVALLEILLRSTDTVKLDQLYETSLLVDLDTDRASATEVFNTLCTRYLVDPNASRDLQASLSLGHPHLVAAATSPEHQGAYQKIDIIIPIHNALSDVKKCLNTLDRLRSPLLGRLILVDDASNRPTARWLDEWTLERSYATVLRNDHCQGFTGACIRGIQESRARWFLLLNSDTIPTDGFLEDLWSAQWAIPRVACVGPLTNTGYFQSLETDFISDTAGYIPSSPDQLPPETVSRFLRALYPKGKYSTLPLLSGFCLLIRREAYNDIGGLNCEMFPTAYGEVQDLCLRFGERNWECCVSHTTFVFHAQGKSYNTLEKTQLLEKGYTSLFALHTAFKVLTAEAICRHDISMEKVRSAYQAAFHGILFPQGSLKHNSSLLSLLSYSTALPASFVGRKVAIFVSYCPDGTLSNDVTLIADSLSRCGFIIIFVANIDEPNAPISDAASLTFPYVILRQNNGYDFGAWRDVLLLHPQLFECERLLFINDSLSVVTSSIDADFQAIANCDTRFFSLCDADAPHWHPQSFCFGWTQPGLNDPYVRDFWQRELSSHDRADAIKMWELELGNVVKQSLPEADITVLYPSWSVFPRPLNAVRKTVPSHYYWRRLIKNGFPFIKTYLLRDGGEDVDMTDAEGWLRNHSDDFERVMLGIERSTLNRIT